MSAIPLSTNYFPGNCSFDNNGNCTTPSSQQWAVRGPTPPYETANNAAHDWWANPYYDVSWEPLNNNDPNIQNQNILNDFIPGIATGTNNLNQANFKLAYGPLYPASSAARDLVFAPANETPTTYKYPYSNYYLYYPNFAFDPLDKTKSRVFTTWRGIQPRHGQQDNNMREWEQFVREDSDWNDPTTTAGLRDDIGEDLGGQLINIANDYQTMNWTQADKDRLPWLANNFADLADAGHDIVQWVDPNKTDNNMKFPTIQYDSQFWFVPIANPGMLSSDTSPAGNSANDCVSGSGYGKCTEYVNSFYNQKTISAASPCDIAKKNWDKMLGRNRSSAIDGAIISTNQFPFATIGSSLISLTPTQCALDKTDATNTTYICSQMNYWPLAINGAVTKNPGNHSNIHWLDPKTRSFKVQVEQPDDGACFYSSVTNSTNTYSGKWKPTGCPRAAPEYQVDPSCSKTPAPCPLPALFSKVSGNPDDADNPAYAPAKAWYLYYLNNTVTPLAAQHYGTDAVKLKNYLSKRDWYHYFQNCQTIYEIKGDTSVGANYCNNNYVFPFFLPIILPGESITVNWWQAWDRVGITEAKVIDMLIGAVPVGYLLYKNQKFELMPLYFIGSLLYMVFSSEYTNTGIVDTLNKIWSDIYNLYFDAYTIWNSTGRELEKARQYLLNVAGYAVLTTLGLGLTYLTVVETGRFSSGFGIEIESDEFLIGVGLTVVADLIWSIYDGDFGSLMSMIAKSATENIFNQIADAFNDAFGGSQSLLRKSIKNKTKQRHNPATASLFY